ncbi:MAG: translation initiation factor IF-3 [Planctomycetes bacterium]|nr:translation initiation factor IF-3 [Planctomycetota bacterium]NOG54095.1 translation initiation factor IF-3 [Planctomycetota bacterium]
MSVRRERVNDMIRISPVRCIGPDNEQYGVIELDEAKSLAREAGLDLVEISADSRPPVCRIMDYGKYKYQQSKKEHKAKSGSKRTEMKEIRLGRSLRIDPHDIQMRMNQVRAFLMDGHKVQIIQPFQGREMQHKQSGYERMREIEDTLADIGKVEMTPRFNGRRMVMIVAPDKAKIQAMKRADDAAAKASADKEKSENKAAEEAKAEAAAEEAQKPDDSPNAQPEQQKQDGPAEDQPQPQPQPEASEETVEVDR